MILDPNLDPAQKAPPPPLTASTACSKVVLELTRTTQGSHAILEPKCETNELLGFCD